MEGEEARESATASAKLKVCAVIKLGYFAEWLLSTHSRNPGRTSEIDPS
jgi:hypothetical protein